MQDKMAEKEQHPAEEQLQQLRMMEQNLQALSSQRQSFQVQVLEIDNALGALNQGDGAVFKMIGQVMIAQERKDLKKDLTSQKEVIGLRVKTLEKQENQLREKASELQKKIVEAMGKR